MKKSTLMIPAFALLALFAGAGNALAFGGQKSTPEEWQTQITAKASLLGITVEEAKSFWAEGKTIKQIMEEKGITKEQLQARMKAAREAEVKAWLKALVDKGFITQAQADARLKVMTEREVKREEAKGKQKGHRGGQMRLHSSAGLGFGLGF